ncbi:hypothetical protein OAJ10_03065 [Paracoccaceae bacterium]|nr:hypothetical protein [Paracoccaceae bacterium]
MSFNVDLEKHPSKNSDRYFRIGFRLICWSLVLLYLYAVLYVVFLPDDGSPEDSRSLWCEEYHPHLSFNECADVAGW